MNRFTKYTAVVAAVVLVGSATRTYGLAENWSAQVSSFLTLQGGTTGVPSGGLIMLGTNNLSIAGMQLLQNNPVGLAAAFTQWGQSSTIGTGTGVDGSFAAVSTSAGAGSTPFFGLQIYLLAFNGATPAASTQVGLYTNPNWTWAASDAAGAKNIDLSDSGLQVIIGSFSAGTITSPGDIAGGDAVQLHLVPEPSSIALAALGLLGLVGFARRRRS